MNNDKKIDGKKSNLEKSGRTIDQIRKGIEELVALEELDKKREYLNEQIRHLETDMKLKEKDAENYEKIQEVGKCVTCGREINDSSGYGELISTANMEKNDIEKEIIKRNEEMSIIRETINENEKNRDLKRDVEEIDSINEANKRLEEKIESLTNEIDKQKLRLNELPDENRLKVVEKEKETAEKETTQKNAANETATETQPEEIPITTKIATLKEIEMEAIKSSVERNKWNMTTTAEELGISRMTLYRKLEQYGLRGKD